MADGEDGRGKIRSAHSRLLSNLPIEIPRKRRKKSEPRSEAYSNDSTIPEGGPEQIVDGDDGDGIHSPFERHFGAVDAIELTSKIQRSRKAPQNSTKNDFGALGKASFFYGRSSSDKEPWMKRVASLKGLGLKQRLLEHALIQLHSFDELQSNLAPYIFSYTDVLVGGRKAANATALRQLVCLHALNHLFRTRDRILKNNERLAHQSAHIQLELRDQGFTRPKILFLVETRQCCVRYVDSLVSLCAPEQQENRKRFQDAFVQADQPGLENKPADFQELFEGNDDNEFRLGIKFTRKTLKFYSQFYSSDIIIASPLGLRRAINPDDPKKADSDFLSSIEIVIVDQVDAMLMQNWEHVEFVFDHLNLQPKEAHGCDFSRVRQWYLDQNARYLRQTILLSAYTTPELNALFSTQMNNVDGKLRILPEHKGSMLGINLQLQQRFSRFMSDSPDDDPNDRFKYFTTSILPALARQATAVSDGLGTLIFIPSYLDFVRLRNYFNSASEAEKLSFGSLSEYSEVAESRRQRSHFFTGRNHVLLYTGRAHHFRRYQIRGVKRVVFYGLPENPVFYTEIVNFLATSIAEGKVDHSEASARILFSKWDALVLERVVGSTRFKRMLKDAGGDTFDFR